MDDKKKLPPIGDKHKEDLALLASRPEFKALEKLCAIEENNIIIKSFKVNSGDPTIAIKKAWYEGRVFELRTILNSFREAKKEQE